MSVPALGERIDRYTLKGQLGTGGMATVYLAEAPGPLGTSRSVALKLVHPHVAIDPVQVATFIEEARIAERIRHPNVVLVQDVAEGPRGPYLVMEYVEGGALSDLVATGPRLPLELGMQILADALAGLHAAHELTDAQGRPLGLVHRDFSPHNILVGIDGNTRLTDFGIAKVADRSAVTAQGLVKGKLAYMAPEQARGQPLDRRADLWAAGVIAWELLAGQRLYGQEPEAMMLLRLLSERPPALRDKNPLIPSALAALVASALSLEPADRPPTAAAFRAGILEVIGTEGTRGRIAELAEWVQRARVSPAGLPEKVAAGATATVLLAPALPSPPPPRRLWIGALAGGIGLAVGAAILAWPQEAPPVIAAPTASADLPLPSAKAPPTEASPPGPSAPVESRAEPENTVKAARRPRPLGAAFRYEADRPVAKLRIESSAGTRTLAGHGARGIVTVSFDELSSARLVFVAEDGAEQAVKPDSRGARLEVHFPKRPALESNPYVTP
ncbi:MAG: serine/threonine-protein kinase [Myxococcota bacterium]